MRFYIGIPVTYNPSAFPVPPEAFQPESLYGAVRSAQEVSAVSQRKTSSLLFSLVLALAILGPPPALGNRAHELTALTASEAGTPASEPAEEGDAEASEADGASHGAQRPKRRGNAFTRALSAPFRALARLFGGGKSKTEAAVKKSSPAPAREAAGAANAPRSAEHVVETSPREAAPEVAKQGQGDAAAPVPPAVAAEKVEAARVEPITTAPARAGETAARESAAAAQTPRATERVRIVRPGAGEVARELQPKMWIPRIVGVPSDPVSQGRALLEHGYIQEAIAELQTAATTGAPHQLAEANNLLGIAYDRLGWHRQAAEAYERSLAVSPKDYVALTNLGYSLYLADDYSGALKRLKQAARLAPSEPVIFNNLGVVNARLGRYGDALKSFVRASNQYEAHLKLAGILEDQRRDKEAVKHYEAALRLQPGTSAVLERLVALYERTGDRSKAETARRALGQPQPNPQKTTTGGGG